MSKKIISCVLSLAMCLSIIAGGTYALFTSESKTNVAINSGKVEVVSTVEDLKLFSQEDINMTTLVGAPIDVEGNTFPNGGTATYANGTLTLDKLTPGDGVTFTIKTANNSNVAIICRTIISGVSGNGLINALVVKINDVEYAGEAISEWTALAVGTNPDDIKVSIELPADAGNAYQNKTASLYIAVEAVQGNVIEVVDKWDGSAVADDFAAEEDGTYLIESAADLSAFAAAVNAGDDFAGKTVTLNANIDLANNAWTSIAAVAVNSPAAAFAGVFDGQNHTISNLKDAALFGKIAATGTVKNVNLKDVSANTPIGGFLACDMLGKAEYCTVKNAVVNSATYGSSGLVGSMNGSGIIDHCSVDGFTLTVTNPNDNRDKVGGLVGFGAGEGVQITNSTASNITLNGVYKTKSWGGLVGRISSGALVEGCTATNVKISVSDYAQWVGGFIGSVADGTVKNSSADGVNIKVNSGGYIGGFCGYTGQLNYYIFENCHVTGLYITLDTDEATAIGGFTGRAAFTSTIKGCSAEGVIDASDAAIDGGNINALIGQNYPRTEEEGGLNPVLENTTANVTVK